MPRDECENITSPQISFLLLLMGRLIGFCLRLLVRFNPRINDKEISSISSELKIAVNNKR
jgi:hypothetical protein